MLSEFTATTPMAEWILCVHSETLLCIDCLIKLSKKQCGDYKDKNLSNPPKNRKLHSGQEVHEMKDEKAIVAVYIFIIVLSHFLSI